MSGHRPQLAGEVPREAPQGVEELADELSWRAVFASASRSKRVITVVRS